MVCIDEKRPNKKFVAKLCLLQDFCLTDVIVQYVSETGQIEIWCGTTALGPVLEPTPPPSSLGASHHGLKMINI